jgi:hypothetical protein
MSFLDNLKKKREAAAAANAATTEAQEPVKKVNPLAALKAKAANPDAEQGEKKLSPLAALKAKKEAAKAAKEAKENTEEVKDVKRLSLQEKAEALVAEKLKDNKPAEETPAKEETPAEEKEAPVAEETPAEEATPAKEEETTEEAKEEPEEKPKKTRRRRKAKKEEEAEAPAETKEEETEKEEKPAKKQNDIKVHEYVANYDILGKKVSYDDMAGAVMDYFIDDDWKATQDDLTEKMNNIRIEPDMNPGTLKYALAELNNLNDEISAVYVEQKQLLDVLTDKEFGAATALLAMNSRGSNSEERKANGFAALTHAKFGGEEEVNLIALINAVKARFVFLNSLAKRIQYKSNTCITMSGAMKMEQSLMTGAGVA